MRKIPDSKLQQMFEEAQADAIRFRKERDAAREDLRVTQKVLADEKAAIARQQRLISDLTKDRDRLLRGIRAIAASKLTGVDFGDWVQAACEDMIEGREVEPVEEEPADAAVVKAMSM